MKGVCFWTDCGIRRGANRRNPWAYVAGPMGGSGGRSDGDEERAKQKATGPVVQSFLPRVPSRVGVSRVAIGQAPTRYGWRYLQFSTIPAVATTPNTITFASFDQTCVRLEDD